MGPRTATRPARSGVEDLLARGPMLATLGELPRGDGWSYEVKWDGVRALALVEPGRLTLLSRNGNDITARYPELAGLAGSVPRKALPLLLDTASGNRCVA